MGTGISGRCCALTEIRRPVIASGTLDAGKLGNYDKLRRELRYLEGRQNHRIGMEDWARSKQLCRSAGHGRSENDSGRNEGESKIQV
jgi:hypothetical protein